MCGPTQAQEDLTEQETQAYKTSADMTAQQYADQKAIYAPLAAQFQSIFAKGPNQRGFSTQESQELNAQAVEGTAENYKQAATAVGENLAARGGGVNPLPSGPEAQLKQEVANSAAQEESRQESSILSADYTQGEKEWADAGTGLMSIATGENPVAYENAQSNSGQVANTEANAIATEDNSWINAAIGAAGAIGGGFAGRH